MKKNVLRQAWLVLLLAVCFGAALAGVHVALSDRIAANRRREAHSQIPNLIEGAVAESAERTELGGRTVYKAFGPGGAQVGWVIRARGSGFQGPVELLIGLDLEGERITGLYVLAQTETPGLGTGITGDKWREQFKAPASEPLEVVKDEPDEPNEVQAITGATVSSQSVCDIVNEAVADVRSAIEAGGEAAG